MSFLNRFTLKSKIIALILIPLIAMMILMAISLNTTHSALSENKQLLSQIIIAEELSLLIHEMQKERGMSAGFLASSGQKFKGELQQQRIFTNKALENLQNRVSKSSDMSANYRRILQNGLDSLKALDSTRKSIDLLQNPSPPPKFDYRILHTKHS